MRRMCACGCGELTHLQYEKRKRKFIRGHNRRGVFHSEETKKKISMSQLGILNHNYGMKHSQEFKEMMSLIHTGKSLSETAKKKLSIRWMREKNPNWKGGISREPYSLDWKLKLKESIKKRDGRKCQNPNCEGKDTFLVVHHKDMNKKNCDPNNLITYCNICHTNLHWEEKRRKNNAV